MHSLKLRTLIAVFIAFGSVTALTKEINLFIPKLGTKIILKDSRFGQPVDTIVDEKGTDFKKIVYGINQVIMRHSPHCPESGRASATSQAMGCNLIGFQPLRANIVPFKSFLKNYNNTDLALVVQGQVNGFRDLQSTSFFIPIENLIVAAKKQESVQWWLSNNGIAGEANFRNRFFGALDIEAILNLN